MKKYFTFWKQCYNTACSDTKHGMLIMTAENIFVYNIVIVRSVRGYGKKRLQTNAKSLQYNFTTVYICQQFSKCFSNHLVELLSMLKRSPN